MAENRPKAASSDESAPPDLVFDSDGLIPVITTDSTTGEVLMQAYMNRDAFNRTIDTGEAVYFSRSRKRLWHKGEQSGNTQRVVEVLVDCDQDCLWLRVEQRGGAACHTGFRSCFYRSIVRDADGRVVLKKRIEKPVFDPSKVYDE